MLSAHAGLGPLVVLWAAVLLLVLFPGHGRAYQELSDETLKILPRANDDFDINNGALLSPILQTRVPGTSGHTAVLNHFADFFRTTLPNWNVEYQNATYKTPVSKGKDVPFVNFIASRDPPWAPVGDVGRVTFAAHYDSKLEPTGFIGAIDSAAPCAMIMHAMRSIDEALTRKWESMEAQGQTDAMLEEHKGIQIIFLDGEEAFVKWTATDSLYGARALAEHWDNEVNPAMSAFKTPLSSISLFVLLDLLGSKDPAVMSHYPTTHWAYEKWANAEKRLRAMKQFKSSTGDASEKPWFFEASEENQLDIRMNGIQDDHVPFITRGVDTLHVIDATPYKGFPEVWHRMDDNAENLDIPTVDDWSLLVTVFAAEWMELEGHFHGSEAGKRSDKGYAWDKDEFI